MSSSEFLKLENQLCFSLYASSRAITRMYRPFLEGLGITYPQYLVLLVLWDQKESTVKELSEKLDLDSGTLTPMLKRMEAQQLVQRKRSSEDERVVNIQITEAGLALYEKALCIPQSLLASSGLSPEEIYTFNEQLKRIISSVNAFD
ncbi:DNA-binding MarR family transcriptional regulator [Paenibacillus sp. V4I3]|jgi:DNA-binding MarR family transcriptional regulator|uniref:MarR family transcriptional regulator n=2 Tax=Paenibacillus TaxID=44249 RepID=A0ABX1Z813_9BACL|nr:MULTISPECIES: MarR family transcriptional regulator [Paenibacillus]KRE50772.1 MarR family transcriptional regulator [Paenibacillus sp. Soil724D2]MDQ0873696.1 DNA-binding MarR family transcriptional regulator [Paenibacillus sp. V4I3]MDQ0890372.1 DNA-binding MarR family transcriptional regulator [Paenibacillus sp. V4I9]NOU71678.1 MarR family transcriptional regulator [Paenibacillus phytorum]NOU88081.1 MarR family transcriptional regulator [Paenibacillus germinis]